MWMAERLWEGEEISNIVIRWLRGVSVYLFFSFLEEVTLVCDRGFFGVRVFGFLVFRRD